MLIQTIAAITTVPLASARTFAFDNVEETSERAPFCNTQIPTKEQQDMFTGRMGGFDSMSTEPITVPVHLHAAVSKSANSSFMSIEQLEEQYRVIRDIYAPYGITLTLGDITRDNSGQYTNFVWEYDQNGYFGGTSPAMERYWRQTRTGGYDELHLYFYQDDARPWGGQCTFPELLQGISGPPYWHDGCHMHSGLLVGSNDPYTNHGKTPAHEAGHWFGLLHVFQGSLNETCNSAGDGVDDTPAQSTPTTFCPEKKNSCPDHPGLDSVHNYMDYSSNECMTEFTPGQKERMHNVFNAFRKGW